MRLRSATPVLLACGLFALRAHAATYTYTYTGNDFTYAVGYTTSMSVTGSFTLSSPLGDNMSLATISPASFTFSDGKQTITNSTGGIIFFEVATDASGDIDYWDIVVHHNMSEITTKNISGGTIRDEGDYMTNPNANNTNDAGTWQGPPVVSVTPEPASLALLGTGLFAAAAVVRRRAARP